MRNHGKRRLYYGSEHNASWNLWHTQGIFDIKSSGTFTLEDTSTGKTGKITGGYGTSGSASGIYVDRGTTTISGGSITGNFCTSGALGGALLINAQANLIMTGGSITENHNSAGVYFYSGTFTVSGTPVISGNYSSDDTACNVYLRDGYSIKVNGGLGDIASIGVTTASTPSRGTPITIAAGTSTYTITSSDSGKFHSDADYNVNLNSTYNTVQLEQTETSTAVCCQPQKGPEPSERLCEADAHGKRHPQIFGGASVSNAMSLKAKIRNIAKQKNIPAQVILQNYMFERLLVRLHTL